MGKAIGDVLPMALGIAIGPTPIIALILILITPKARTNGIAFAVGWVLGLCVVAFGVLAIANGAGVSTSGGASKGAAVLKLAFGLLFLVLATKQWKSRPQPGAEPSMPKWMSSIDSFTPGKSAGLAALLSGANPKNLILTATAASTVAAVAGLSGGQQVASMAVFVVLASLTVLAPLVVYLAAGSKASAILGDWKTWLAHNNATVMFVVFLIFGALLLGKGIAGLT
jgi:hypothetical protein